MLGRDQDMADNPFASKQKRFSILPEAIRSQKTTILKWGIAGYLVRIAIMPLFAHADLITNARVSATLYQSHQLINSTYPPSIAFFFTSLYALFSPVLPTMILNNLTSNTSYLPVRLFSMFQLLQPGTLTFIFISKIPYLVFDVALSILVLHIVDDQKKALLAFKLWIANPISIYICYVMGQFDIIPAFFLILALYFFKKRRELSSIASIGISAAFKVFGLLFLPPMAIIYSKEHTGLKSKGKHLSLMLIVGALPLIVSQIATFLTPTYYESANLAWPVTSEINGFYGKTFYIMGQGGNILGTSLFYLLSYSTKFTTFSFDTIYVVILLYGLFLLGVNYFADWSLGKVWKAFLVFLLAYYAFSLFHPQWFLLGLPLLILLVSEDRRRYFGIYVLVVSLFFVYLGYWNDFFTSIFIPIIHQAYFWPGEIDLLNGLGLQGYQIISIFRSLLSAAFVVLLGFVLNVDRLFHKSKAT